MVFKLGLCDNYPSMLTEAWLLISKTGYVALKEHTFGPVKTLVAPYGPSMTRDRL